MNNTELLQNQLLKVSRKIFRICALLGSCTSQCTKIPSNLHKTTIYNTSEKAVSVLSSSFQTVATVRCNLEERVLDTKLSE